MDRTQRGSNPGRTTARCPCNEGLSTPGPPQQGVSPTLVNGRHVFQGGSNADSPSSHAHAVCLARPVCETIKQCGRLANCSHHRPVAYAHPAPRPTPSSQAGKGTAAQRAGVSTSHHTTPTATLIPNRLRKQISRVSNPPDETGLLSSQSLFKNLQFIAICW